jgi:hypothetical protein
LRKVKALLGLLALFGLVTVASATPANAYPVGGDIPNSYPAGLAPHGYSAVPPICPEEQDHCLNDIVDRMQAGYDNLGCDHNSVFSLLYLDTTHEIVKAVRGGEFSDTPFWDKVTKVFGTYYMDSLDAWRANPNTTQAPDAWKTAFNDAESGKTSTVGDIMLGINAHVNRDLAYVYYQIGASSYADHFHVNTVLNRAVGVAYPDIFAHLDSTVYAQLFQIPASLDLDIFAWRDVAWNNAQRLLAAPNAEARAAISAEIEANANAHAREIEAAFPATADQNAARDSYCAVNK